MKGFGRILIALVIILAVAARAFSVYYLSRFQTISSIQKMTAYDTDYNLYRMDVQYEYSIDRIISKGLTDDQKYTDAVLAEALPLLPIHM